MKKIASENEINRRKLLEKVAKLSASASIISPLVASTSFSQTDKAYDPGSTLGSPANNKDGYGERSAFENDVRKLKGSEVFAARTLTPLQKSTGIITPSGLHFERHHGGVPNIIPKHHKLVIEGMLEVEKIFSLEDIKRFPSFTGIYFIECSGNGRSSWAEKPKAKTVQDSHGMTSNSEWTGVKLSVLLNELGLKKNASWLIAEGADSSHLSRSIPLEKCLDDALLAYGQNGEALRPEQGYPLRLVLPGWEGNCQVKWLRRLIVTDKPFMSHQETAKYTDLLKSGKSEQFSFVMEPKSVITSPSGGMKLDSSGYYEITGLAWSGLGKISKVEVSVDGGKTWSEARLQVPVLSKSHTRFNFDWVWDKKPCVLQSRCEDEFGNKQPSRKNLIDLKGRNVSYHMNAIHSWSVDSNGQIFNIHI